MHTADWKADYVHPTAHEISIMGIYTYSADSVFSRFSGVKQGPKFALTFTKQNTFLLRNMKQTVQRDLRASRPSRKSRAVFDQTTALGGLTLALFAYILYYFIYPMVAKGLLW